MSIPGNANPLLLASAAADAAAAGPIKSLRFNPSDTPSLSKTFASAGNRRTWTWAGWVKRSSLTAAGLFTCYTGVNNDSGYFNFGFDGSYKIIIGGWSTGYLQTDAVFRDFSAWYHIVLAFDSTQSTQSNRIKLYINGSQATSFSVANYVSQNAELPINSANSHNVGANVFYTNTQDKLDGYLADVYFIDGSQLDPTSFGAFDDNGVWQAAAYSGTFGTNGFHLDFADGSDLGDDNSGNGNDFTANNLSNFDGTVATADGALPILNTTGNYGGTVGSGTRTDSNSSSIVLALPMNGTNGGTTFTDQHATIKGSGSAKTITAYADAQTSTAQSYFYGSSAKFDGTGDYLASTETDIGNFGTGDFTVEYWCKNNSTQPSPNYSPQVGTLADTTPGGTWRVGTFQSNGYLTLATHDGSNFGDVTFNTTNYNDDKWHHFCVQRSSGTVTAYVDGVSIGTASVTTNFNATKPLQIGREGYSPTHYTGYIQDLRIYKGAAKYSSNFNPPSRTGGSGCDSLFDVPTNGTQSDTGAGGEVSGNYCCWNPLALQPSGHGGLSQGNLEIIADTAGSHKATLATFALPSTGKWYWEVKAYRTGGTNNGGGAVGVAEASAVASTAASGTRLGEANSSSWVLGLTSFDALHANTADYSDYLNGGTVEADTGIIGIAVDMDNDKMWMHYNGTYGNAGGTGNPATGANPMFSGEFSGLTLFPAAGISVDSGSGYITANWGQRSFSYSAPSGFKALCTTNLPTPTIADGSAYFEAKLYTGNGGTNTITGLEFSPDWTWIKKRNSNSSHSLHDTVRGATKRLRTESTDAETTETTALTAFTSDGFTLGSGGTANGNNDSFVSWNWDAGSSTVSNTDGSITSSVRANASAGFSIITYTGNATSGATIGHGLNAAPQLIIIKRRDAVKDWIAYHSALGNSAYVKLNTTDAKSTGSLVWAQTDPTSSVFSVGGSTSNNASGGTYVGYCISSVAGYSAFGSYTGNGSSDGPFVFTGFRPAFLMWKLSSAAGGHWNIEDDGRSPFNPVTVTLRANTNETDLTTSQGQIVDLLSNGFKVKNTSGQHNTSGETYVYMAFASNPFQANGGLAR